MDEAASMAASLPLDGTFRRPLNSFVADQLDCRVLAGIFRDEVRKVAEWPFAPRDAGQGHEQAC